MLRFCIAGLHVFDDGVKVASAKANSTDEIISMLNTIKHEQVACNDCWKTIKDKVNN